MAGEARHADPWPNREMDVVDQTWKILLPSGFVPAGPRTASTDQANHQSPVPQGRAGSTLLRMAPTMFVVADGVVIMQHDKVIIEMDSSNDPVSDAAP